MSSGGGKAILASRRALARLPRRTARGGRIMTGRRLFAIALIYLLVTGAWGFLGGSLVVRTGEFDGKLAREVASLWGGEHVQVAPVSWIQRPKPVTEQVQEKDASGRSVTRTMTRPGVDSVPVALSSSRLRADLDLDQRRKGLLWFDTYAVRFAGSWKVRNPDPETRRVFVRLTFPSTEAIYDGFRFTVNGVAAGPVRDLSAGIEASADVPPGGEVPVEVAYTSRGLGQWSYAFAAAGVAQVEDFALAMRTDFAAIDFPAGAMSPTTKTRAGDGWDLAWRFERLVTGQRIAMDLPNRINPGPLAARITWFAPVSLLFFLAVTVILGVLGGQSLHPMHYAFVSAGFFAFHLLLAYLVDHLDIHASFAIASMVSVGLVVSYLRAVAGTRFALRQAGLAQLVFLVLFSYAFFFEGYTGLTVTIGAIVTLFVLMQLTARVDWARAFTRPEGARA
jgi:hypothetical protein